MLDPLSAFAKEHGVLDAGRVALYGGNTSTDEDVRMSLWQLGVAVRDSATDLKDWVDNIKDWENDDDEEDEDEEDDDDDGTAGSDGGKPSAVVVAGSSSAGNDDDEDELGFLPRRGAIHWTGRSRRERAPRRVPRAVGGARKEHGPR